MTNKKDDAFYRDMQRFVAISAIGPSALRGQGASGVIKACQDHLYSLDLKRFRCRSEKAFLLTLDEVTEELRKVFPKGARNWGSARSRSAFGRTYPPVDPFTNDAYK